eukprot:UN10660
MKVSGEFLLKLKDLCGSIIMFFIGLKLQIPRQDSLHVFLPILIRRGFSCLLISLFQVMVNYGSSTYVALLVWSMAANSIWPYVHLQASLKGT